MNALEKLNEPAVSHRFLASFFFKNIPSPLDLRFQRISGLGREMDVTSHREGGDNVGSLYLPERISHSPLVLERGVMVVTPLSLSFNKVMSDFASQYLDVVIMLLNHQSLPVCTWTLRDAMPVKWHTGDLDAQGNAVLINRLELVYRDMQWLGVKA